VVIPQCLANGGFEIRFRQDVNRTRIMMKQPIVAASIELRLESDPAMDRITFAPAMAASRPN